MATKFISKDDIFWESEEIEDEYIEAWRWGENRYRVFKHEGKFYECNYRTQPEEGVVDYIEPVEVELVEEEKTIVVKNWIPVKK